MGLYSTYVSPLQAAYRHIAEITLCEPEMWMSLSAIKISWTCSRTKQYTPPISSAGEGNSVALKYRPMPKELENLSFIAWLRVVNHTSNSQAIQEWKYFARSKVPKFSKPRVFSPTCPYERPSSSFARVVWSTSSISTIFRLCRHIKPTDVVWYECRARHAWGWRKLKYAVVNALKGRDRYYDSQCASIDCDEENSADYFDESMPSAHSNSETFDWTRPILVTGSPGTGKTQTVFAAIDRCIAE